MAGLVAFLVFRPHPVLSSCVFSDTRGVVPCGNPAYSDQPILQQLSCGLASSGAAAVVVGAVESVSCTGQESCPPDGQWLYNVALGVGGDGSILAVYRKAHLFSEASCLDPGTPMPVTFTATLPGGARASVGLLVCYDVEFHAAVASLVAAGADAIALPMQWMNTVPVSSAQALQQAVSYAYNTTLLAVRQSVCLAMCVCVSVKPCLCVRARMCLCVCAGEHRPGGRRGQWCVRERHSGIHAVLLLHPH